MLQEIIDGINEIALRWKLPMPSFFKKMMAFFVAIFSIGLGLLGAHKTGLIDLETYKFFGVTLLTIVTHMESAVVLAALAIRNAANPKEPAIELQELKSKQKNKNEAARKSV